MPRKRDVSAALYWRPHDIEEWRRDPAVATMSLVARAIFSELLDWQWQNGYLHESPERLRAMVRATHEEWAQFEPFLDELFPAECGQRSHAPTREAWDAQMEICEKRSRSGKQKGINAVAQGEQLHATTNPSDDDLHVTRESNAEQMLTSCSTDREGEGEGEELSNESSPPLPPPEFEPNPRESEALDRWDRHLRETRGRGVGLMQRGELLRDARRRRPGWLPDAVDLAVKNGWLKLVCPDEVDAKSGVSDAWVAADRATAVVEKVLGVKS